MTLCGKNPNRVKSAGRPKREPGQVAAEASRGGSDGIQMVEEPVAPESAPKFEAVAPDSPGSPVPPVAGAGLAPPTVDVGAIIDVACMMADQKIEEMTLGLNQGPPTPPKRISDPEKDQLKSAAAGALMAYPQVMTPEVAKWLPMLNLGFVVVAVLLPRLIQGKAYIAYHANRGASEGAAAKRIEPIAPPAAPEPGLTDVGDAWIRAQAAKGAALNG